MRIGTPLSDGATRTESKPVRAGFTRKAERAGSVTCTPAVTSSGKIVKAESGATLGAGACVSRRVARNTFEESRIRGGILKRKRMRFAGKLPTETYGPAGGTGAAKTCT